MTCIIIDDEATARAIIRKCCELSGTLSVVGEFDNALEAVKFLNRDPVDLAFVDIHMPGFSGFDFMETVRVPPVVILTTSDTEKALESYEYAPVVDFLVKPIGQERFEKALAKARQRSASSAVRIGTESGHERGISELFVNIDRRLIRISFEDIQLIEAQGDYIQIKTDKETIRVHTTLKKIREKLPEEHFLQIHRSYIIHTGKIIDIEDNSVLIGKNVVPISRGNRQELMRRLNLL